MIRLKSARRGKEEDPKYGSDDVLVLTYEVTHATSGTKDERGSILSLDVKVRIDEATHNVKASVHIRDLPEQSSVAEAFAKLGRWCARLGEELKCATETSDPSMMAPTLMRKP